MPLTEFITLTYSSASPLAEFYRHWSVSQSGQSAYPVTFYTGTSSSATDPSSSSVVHVLSGWHGPEEYSRWWRSDTRRAIMYDMPSTIVISRQILLNMDFDTIPRICRGLMCVDITTVHLGNEQDDDEDCGPWQFQNMKRSMGVTWTGCGEDMSSPTIFYRFTLYEGHITEESVPDVAITMRRVTIPT